MKLIRPGAIVLAAILAAPALYQGFVAHGTDTGTAMIRLLIAIPVATVILAVFDWVLGLYGPDEEPLPVSEGGPKITVSAERRRASDVDDTAQPGRPGGEKEGPQGELPAGFDPTAEDTGPGTGPGTGPAG